jgi:hypothetical protein
MITEFLEGETYTNPSLEQDIMVLGRAEKTQDTVLLSVLYIDRDTTETIDFGELEVHLGDYQNWKVADYD